MVNSIAFFIIFTMTQWGSHLWAKQENVKRTELSIDNYVFKLTEVFLKRWAIWIRKIGDSKGLEESKFWALNSNLTHSTYIICFWELESFKCNRLLCGNFHQASMQNSASKSSSDKECFIRHFRTKLLLTLLSYRRILKRIGDFVHELCPLSISVFTILLVSYPGDDES